MSLSVNLSCELEKIHDFLEVIEFYELFEQHFHFDRLFLLGLINTRYDIYEWSEWLILNNIWTDLNLIEVKFMLNFEKNWK